MPLVTCPNCPTTLRIPDGTKGRVRCPKCQTAFPVVPPSPPAAPAFEVLEEPTPVKPAPPRNPAAPAAKPSASAVSKPAPPPAAKPTPKPPPQPAPQAEPEPLVADFDVVEDDEDDRPRKKNRRDDDDDDDDRPRKKNRRDEDDDDDRPRSKKRRDDDDDDDDRPRGKKKKRRDYDDEDDDDDRQSSRKRKEFGPAKTGMMMVSISLWIYVGTLCLLAFFLFLAWVGVSIPDALMLITGLVGLANWVVGLIGLGFTIAGPSKARGLAIAATAVAVVHLVLAFVVANNSKSVNNFNVLVPLLSFRNKLERFTELQKSLMNATDPAKRKEIQKEIGDTFGDKNDLRSEKSEMRWPDLATMLPFADVLLLELCYESKNFSNYVLGLIAGLVEVARMILIILLIGAVGRAARDREVGDRAPMATIAASVGVGIAMLIMLLIAVIVHESGSKTESSLESGLHWLVVGAILTYLIHIGTLAFPSVLALQASSAAGRKAR